MSELFRLSNLSYEVENFTIFDKIHGHVEEGEVIGIIGKNGSGKSTLLQLIDHKITPTEGHIQWRQNDMEIAVVEQEIESYSTGADTPEEAALLEKWGVPVNDFPQLSGGEKLKVRLAKQFSKGAALLLLDEPTNHLDKESLDLLSSQVKNYRGTIIFVSHDRSFLDEAATKIWSIEGTKLIEHKGNYSSYMEVRRQRRLTRQREYEKQKKLIERIEGQMSELTSWSQKAHNQSTKQEGKKEYYRKKAKRMDTQVKSKQKRLEKELARVKASPVEPEDEVRFSLKANSRKGKRFLEVKNVSKKYGTRTLFKNVNFLIQHGEKVALTGPNGSGKTTLLHILLGREDAEGEVWMSPSVNVGYLTQEVFDLPLTETPAQLFYKETFQERGRVQTLMKHLGFTADHWNAPIETMSMGERIKCKLMKYILEEKDVLFLDEPTNHLDLPSREQLESTLEQYNGTLLVVSHDHYFLEKITDSKLVLSKAGLEKQWGGTPVKMDEREQQRLQLETERQEILGRLSFMTPGDQQYAELDHKFNELTKRIKGLS